MLAANVSYCPSGFHRFQDSDDLMFAEFALTRGLGLINEQIDWKQRFFVPTGKEKGIAVLDILLARYPMIPREVSDESEIASIEPQELSKPQIVNLDEWFVPVTEAAPVSLRARRD